jgi:hypothetical protein
MSSYPKFFPTTPRIFSIWRDARTWICPHRLGSDSPNNNGKRPRTGKQCSSLRWTTMDAGHRKRRQIIGFTVETGDDMLLEGVILMLHRLFRNPDRQSCETIMSTKYKFGVVRSLLTRMGPALSSSAVRQHSCFRPVLPHLFDGWTNRHTLRNRPFQAA